jgi:hypothetical protein
VGLRVLDTVVKRNVWSGRTYKIKEGKGNASARRDKKKTGKTRVKGRRGTKQQAKDKKWERECKSVNPPPPPRGH